MFVYMGYIYIYRGRIRWEFTMNNDMETRFI